VLNALASNLEQDMESDIAKALEYRYGDGLVYLPKYQPESLFKMAKTKGFVDQEGYLTRKGRSLLARYQFA
jgi:translation initiation factor 2 beta subunit (eIF-2beta)/eIF-5